MSYTKAKVIRLIKRDGRVCSECNKSEWNGLPIPLTYYNTDKRTYSSDDNCKLICFNCDSILQKV